jgi:hypothetical protein
MRRRAASTLLSPSLALDISPSTARRVSQHVFQSDFIDEDLASFKRAHVR